MTVEFVAGDPYAQVFIAMKPMTAPANALVSADKLGRVKTGDLFCAALRVKVQEMPSLESTLPRTA